MEEERKEALRMLVRVGAQREARMLQKRYESTGAEFARQLKELVGREGLVDVAGATVYNLFRFPGEERGGLYEKPVWEVRFEKALEDAGLVVAFRGHLTGGYGIKAFR